MPRRLVARKWGLHGKCGNTATIPCGFIVILPRLTLWEDTDMLVYVFHIALYKMQQELLNASAFGTVCSCLQYIHEHMPGFSWQCPARNLEDTYRFLQKYGGAHL